MNAFVRDPLKFLTRRPFARLRQIVAQTLTTSTFTGITFTSADIDSDWIGGTGHSNSVNTSRYTANYAGWYQASGGVAYAANATGRRVAAWAVNGARVNGSQAVVQATTAFDIEVPARTEFVFLAVGDYLELQGFQESGGNLLTNVSADAQSTMNVIWVSS
jgi:hypothetical protein